MRSSPGVDGVVTWNSSGRTGACLRRVARQAVVADAALAEELHERAVVVEPDRGRAPAPRVALADLQARDVDRVPLLVQRRLIRERLPRQHFELGDDGAPSRHVEQAQVEGVADLYRAGADPRAEEGFGVGHDGRVEGHDQLLLLAVESRGLLVARARPARLGARDAPRLLDGDLHPPEGAVVAALEIDPRDGLEHVLDAHHVAHAALRDGRRVVNRRAALPGRGRPDHLLVAVLLAAAADLVPAVGRDGRLGGGDRRGEPEDRGQEEERSEAAA